MPTDLWTSIGQFLAGGAFVALVVAVFRFIGSGRNQDAAEFVRLTTRITTLETKHDECIEQSGILQGQIAVLESKDEQKDEKIAELKKEVESLRNWRHDVAGKAQELVADVAAAAIEKDRAARDQP